MTTDKYWMFTYRRPAEPYLCIVRKWPADLSEAFVLQAQKVYMSVHYPTAELIDCQSADSTEGLSKQIILH